MGLSFRSCPTALRSTLCGLVFPMLLGAADPAPEYLAVPGTTSGYWAHLGKPWVCWDGSQHLLIAYMVPAKDSENLCVRRFTMGQGWGPEETVIPNMKGTPWLSTYWYPAGPSLTWCEQNIPTLGHHHPFLLWENNAWQRAREIHAPDFTYVTGRHFPKGRTPFLEHVVNDPNAPKIWRILRVETPEGGRNLETFRFEVAGGRYAIRPWERADGTCWCAVLVPGKKEDTCKLDVERLDKNGHRSRLTLAKFDKPGTDLLACASEEGWALVAWTEGPRERMELSVRIRTPHRWLPPVKLGEISRTGSDLWDDVWVSIPDKVGRMALGWIRKGASLSADFDPVKGWSKPLVRGQGAEIGDWATNKKGERMLCWGKRQSGKVFYKQRWSPRTGWDAVQEIPMPEGRMPIGFLFDDGHEMAVGLAQDEKNSGLVRPWSMTLNKLP